MALVDDKLKNITTVVKDNNNQSNETNSNTAATTAPKGVDDAVWKSATSTYTKTNEQKKLDSVAQSDLSNFRDVASNTNIIGQSTWDILNSQFKVPTAVTEADAYLSAQLEKIQSGKTSYTDQIKDMMSQIQNRDKFSYDVDTDPLFQQALSSAMNSGKQAMQDTIGQASALTGGYGSTYATSAGNQAYNAFIEDAYNNLPQYYQMALEAYQMEGDEMYRQLGMLNDADATEYNRNVTAYDATYQHRNQIYNEAYTQYRDNKNDAFNMANLQLSENSQLVNNAYNMYNASSNYAESMYSREYQQWTDSINQLLQIAGLQTNDYWTQSEFDEKIREYEKTYEQVEKWNQKDDDYRYAELTKKDEWNQQDLEYKYKALAQDKELTYASLNAKKSSDGSGGTVTRNGVTYKEATETQNKKALDAYNNGGYAALEQYVASLPDDVDVTGITEYVQAYNNWDNWVIKDDTKNWNNWLVPGNDDMNDTYTFGGETKTFSALKKEIEKSSLPQSEKDAILDNLRKQSKK